MYPQIPLRGSVYTIDYVTPFIGIALFIVILYKITKSQGLRFRDIVSKLPLYIIITLLSGTYTHFVFQSGHFFPTSWAQFTSLFSLSVTTIDFVGLVAGCFIATLMLLSQMSPKSRSTRCYVLMLTCLYTLVPLGILYTLGDSVVGKFNQGFFSIGSFTPQSRISQLGGSVYPLGLMIAAWSLICIGVAGYMRRRYDRKAGYRLCSLFMIGYLIILHYQHYPRHLIVNIGFVQMDLRSYLCIAIACITGYFGYSVAPVHRFVFNAHEDTIGETR